MPTENIAQPDNADGQVSETQVVPPGDPPTLQQ
jgi:hypothetical protein